MKRFAMTKNRDRQYDQFATAGNLIPNQNKTTCLFLNVYFSPWKNHFLQLFQHFVVGPNPSLPNTY